MESSTSASPSLALVKPFFFVLLVLLVASILIPKGEDVLLINGHHSLLADQFFKMITNLGDGLVILPIVAVALFIQFRQAIVITISSVAVGLLVSLFKRVLFPEMIRPKMFLPNDLIHFVPGVHVHGAHSFPSGHTATAFCAALLIALISRNKVWSGIALLLAILVGYSRLYLAQHFLMDVAAGALLGCFPTFILWHWMENLSFPKWANQKLSFVKGSKNQPTSGGVSRA